MLESITDEDTFDYNGLGGILGIPQDLMVSLASVLSSSVLLLGKSPKLVIILYCITQLQSLASNQLGLGINHLTTMIGFDDNRIPYSSARTLAYKIDGGKRLAPSQSWP